MQWQWIQDSDFQGRAVCRDLGLALVVVVMGCGLYAYWRYRGELVLEATASSVN